MVNGNERFVDIACELTGEKSPNEIRILELNKIIAAQTIEQMQDKQDSLFKAIFEDPENCYGEGF